MPFKDIALNDGSKIPALAFGSGSVNKGKDIHAYIEQAIEAGFSHLDTAQHYDNEESVGRAIRESGLERSQLYVTTKYSDGNTPLRQTLNASLKKLGLKQLDLYLIHNPRSVPDYVNVWKQFVSIQNEGLSKSIGVSNFNIAQLEELRQSSKVTPAVNQIRLHLYNYAETKALLKYHAAHGIVTEAFGSLAPITWFPGGPVDEPLQAAANRLGITPTQVIFLWLRDKGVVIVTTSSKREHLDEYVKVGDLPPLTNKEIEALEKAGAQGPPPANVAALVAQRVRGFPRNPVFRIALILSAAYYLISQIVKLANLAGLGTMALGRV